MTSEFRTTPYNTRRSDTMGRVTAYTHDPPDQRPVQPQLTHEAAGEMRRLAENGQPQALRAMLREFGAVPPRSHCTVEQLACNAIKRRESGVVDALLGFLPERAFVLRDLPAALKLRCYFEPEGSPADYPALRVLVAAGRITHEDIDEEPNILSTPNSDDAGYRERLRHIMTAHCGLPPRAS